MTDHGFRKFRRRRKRDETPAQDSVHPDEPLEAPSVDQPKSDANERTTPVKPVRPMRPSRSNARADHVEISPAASAPARSLRVDNVSRKTAPRDSVATSESPRQPSVQQPQASDQTTASKQAASPQFAAPLLDETSASLPVALPDPWHVMRHVEVTGLNERRSRLPLVDFFRSSPTARAFDLLRTRMLHSLRAHGWKRVAICGPTPGCGASFTAANLALSLARVPNSRTVLMDLNLRNPGIARTLGLERPALYNGDMLGFLRGEIRLEEHLMAASDRLALGLNTKTFHNAAEVLHEFRCASIIDDLVERTRADVALFDLPPVLHNDDVAAFLPQVDGVLLVSDGSQTTARHLKACEKMLAGHTQLLGVVLNRARNEDEFSGGA